jgi:hypothetical protein
MPLCGWLSQENQAMVTSIQRIEAYRKSGGVLVLLRICWYVQLAEFIAEIVGASRWAIQVAQET